jgi:large subunit ribosomal protein L3
VFDEQGKAVAVTVIQAGPRPVVQKKTADRDGYAAIQIGFGAVAKGARLTRPARGHFDKAQAPYQRHLGEIRLRGEEGDFQVGQVLTVALFAAGDRVRAPGSIGASSYPSRVFRGHHLPGHMGAVRQTVRGLRVVAVDSEKHLLLIRGAIPGPTGGLLTIRKGK